MSKRACSIEGCTNPHQAKGYCMKHYRQIDRHGRLTPELERLNITNKGNECSIENCSKEAYAKGFCRYHYANFREFGKPIRNSTMKAKGEICTIEGCSKDVKTKGLCQNHYDNFVYYRKKYKLSLEEYLANKNTKASEHIKG